MEKLSSSELVSIAIIVIGAATMLYIVYHTFREGLFKREQIVKESMNNAMFDNQGSVTNDGYIFTKVWRMSHIQIRAKQLGYELTHADCFSIIARLKMGFDPYQGINFSIIDMAIHEYVKRTIACQDDVDKQLRHIYRLDDLNFNKG